MYHKYCLIAGRYDLAVDRWYEQTIQIINKYIHEILQG